MSRRLPALMALAAAALLVGAVLWVASDEDLEDPPDPEPETGNDDWQTLQRCDDR
jgi:hypothetical protein